MFAIKKNADLENMSVAKDLIWIRSRYSHYIFPPPQIKVTKHIYHPQLLVGDKKNKRQ